MTEFKRCYPDANNFDKVIKIHNVDNWNCKYFSIDKDYGYWITDPPFDIKHFEIFKNLIASFPIQKDNSALTNFDPNPFDSIHLPEWIYKDICYLLIDFYSKNISNDIYLEQIHEWGNLYFRELTKPISCWRIPHVDYVNGLVTNLWFTDHSLDMSCTKLFHYEGKMYETVYDFQVDETHKFHKQWVEISRNATRANNWFNMPDEELKKWGFNLLASIPTNEKTMTMYIANIPHLAYVDPKVDFRWSHSFAFSFIPVPKTLNDLRYAF